MDTVTIAMQATPLTWILVADAKQARVYARQKSPRRIPLPGNARHRHYTEQVTPSLELVEGMAWQAESPEIYETGRNATGMVFQSVGGARHMSEPHLDARSETAQHFAAAVAGHLNAALKAKKFERLVLVAPPRMLGELRKHLDGAVQKIVLAELPKDFTQYEGSLLLRQVTEALRVANHRTT
jgi:protein required for attachment to host cells